MILYVFCYFVANKLSTLSLKVIDFGTNRKPIGLCDFLLVIKTYELNLPPIFLHRFQVMADWSNFRC